MPLSTPIHATGDSKGLRVAGRTDVGRQREHNEDRIYINADAGIFLVVDGVGGQAAGEVAAEIACTVIPERLQRPEGTMEARIREAIALANREILKQAQANPAQQGMACVLTVAVLEDDMLTVGHVGDTRLYEIDPQHIRKITKDHSVVGYLEAAGRLTETQAMARPDRNQILREVGTEELDPYADEFIDVYTTPFRRDAALLLCSDGLTDLVISTTIHDVVLECAGHPEHTVEALIALANQAGGTDNISVIIVEGPDFTAPALPDEASTTLRGNAFEGEAPAGTQAASEVALALPGTEPTTQRNTPPAPPVPTTVPPAAAPSPTEDPPQSSRPRPIQPVRPRRQRTNGSFLLGLLAGVLLTGAGVLAARALLPQAPEPTPSSDAPRLLTVAPNAAFASIEAALAEAAPGDIIEVAPGTYAGPLHLKAGVTLLSRVPHGAILSNPAAARDSATVIATGIPGENLRARLIGFRLDGETRQPIGLLIDGASVDVVNTQLAGYTEAAIDVRGPADARISDSRIEHTAGVALRIAAPAEPRLSNTVITSDSAAAAIVVEAGARPEMSGTLFHTPGTDRFVLIADGWTLPAAAPVADAAPADSTQD